MTAQLPTPGLDGTWRAYLAHFDRAVEHLQFCRDYLDTALTASGAHVDDSVAFWSAQVSLAVADLVRAYEQLCDLYGRRNATPAATSPDLGTATTVSRAAPYVMDVREASDHGTDDEERWVY